MSALFRLTGAVKRDPAVDAWLDAQRGEPGATVNRWFRRLRECGSDVRERMHDGNPVACIGDLPFAYVATFTSHVNVGFFQGAALPDPSRLLEGSGKRMRHVKCRPSAPPSAVALEALIAAAYKDMRLRAGSPA